MNSDIYHLVTVENGQADAAAILQVFSRMAAGTLKYDLRLVNYYDELPVSYGSTLMGAESDSIELAVHEQQALIMKKDKSTLLKSSHFHGDLAVHCYAAYVNVAKKTVILHNFAYAQIRAERREAVRVAVYGGEPVCFSYDSGKLLGSMVDISGNGISVLCEAAPVADPNQPGILNFSVAGTPLAVRGIFVRALENGTGGHVCVFQTNPDRRSDTLIGQFIYQRQVDIIQQLKEGLVVG
jgi:hypothetical protein